jgi:4-amino-4-deoxy-L-arabinose transferase-like glycosyltransferase
VLMRVVPMACWIVSAILATRLCRELPLAPSESPRESSRQAACAVGLLLLSPLFDLLGVALVPDTLLMPLVLAAMLTTWRLRNPARARHWRAWAGLALLLGLAVLSKYTAVFIVMGSALSLASFHGRSLWRYRGLWLTAAIVMASMAPVVYWNIQHDWASFAYQIRHAAGDQDWKIVNMARALALQLGVYGFLVPVGLTVALRRRPPVAGSGQALDASAARNMALVFGAPVLLTFTLLAGRGSSLPHWTACGWTALIPLTVAGCMRLKRRWAWSLVAWQGLLLCALVVALFEGGFSGEYGSAAHSPPGLRPPGSMPNPVADLLGWESAALHGAGLAEQHRAGALVVMNWSLASRLAWYARPMPVIVIPDRADQFALWFGHLEVGESALVVDWSQMPLPIPMGRDGFESCRLLDQIDTVQGGRQIAHFNYILCLNWHAGSAGLVGDRETPTQDTASTGGGASPPRREALTTSRTVSPG